MSNFDDCIVTTGGDDEVSIADLAAEHPEWLDDSSSVVRLVRRDARPDGLGSCDLPDHPLFTPWKEAVLATACPGAALALVPGGDPAPDASFGGGTVAFLESAEWPTCTSCRAPLEMVFQIAGRLHRPWTRRDESLVAMYCFACHPDDSNQGEGQVLLAFVNPTTKAERVAGERTAPPVTLRSAAPAWQFPDAMWFSFRAEDAALGGASEVLLASTVEHDGRTLEVSEEYNGWVSPEGGYETAMIPTRKVATDAEWRTALGGYPSWDQADATPSCPECGKEMIHVLDYNGQQFLDGAMHVFMCDRGRCNEDPKLAMVAEF